MSYPLRPYQVDGVQRLRERMLAGVDRLLFVLATGGGKTVVAAHLVACGLEKGSRQLFLAHRRELIVQCFVKLVRNGINPDETGIIMADTPLPTGGELFNVDVDGLSDGEIWRRFGRRRPNARVFVGSIDTARRRALPADIDLIIIDEAHRALAKSYVDLVAAFPRAIVLGLTATPYRADGKGLGDLFDELVVIATPRQLVAEGFLVEPECWTVPVSARPDMSKVKIRGGDYEAEGLRAAVDQQQLVGDIVEHWQRHAAGVRTVAFACSVEHSKHIAQRFVDAGIRAEHLDGETPTPEREAILARLERGETLVVSNCGVLCEGWDQPAVKCAILARPTKSRGLVMQQAGRVLRPWNDQRAIILDHAGCLIEHGLPTDEREFTLAGDAKKAANAGMFGGRECPDCQRILPGSAKVCPSCGYVFHEAPPAEIAEVAGELVQASVVQSDLDLIAYNKIVEEWHKRNAKRAAPLDPGWCWHRFKEKFGRSPPPGYYAPTLAPELVAKRARFEALKAEAASKGYDPMWAHAQAARLEALRVAPAKHLASSDAPESLPVSAGGGEVKDGPCSQDKPASPPSAQPVALSPWERRAARRAATSKAIELEVIEC